jgi:hypothetical protein
MYESSFFDSLLLSPEAFKQFCADNREFLYTTTGKFYKPVQDLADGAPLVKRQPLVMAYLGDQTQVNYTWELFGHPFKGNADSVNIADTVVETTKGPILVPAHISDLKTVANVNEEKWSPIYNRRISWILEGYYHVQGAMYREAHFQRHGVYLPFYIVAVNKGSCRVRIVRISDAQLEAGLKLAENAIASIDRGEFFRCEACEYCDTTQYLTEVETLE